ncbi:L-aspartate oxidase [Gracilibacillus dipsosauri]|uniref:L-aspartate oxidase n=1 Tax=Gracilibacillus dipsosauri TaxID=178340 RepID=UPI00240A0E54
MTKQRVIIVGAGLAAFVLADRLYKEKEVVIITKESIQQNNSLKAQGGVAAAIDTNDSAEIHRQDTMKAGVQYNDPSAVEVLTKEGTERIKEWIHAGFPFDKDQYGKILLGREGAHQKRRILHVGGDQSGKYLVSYLQEKLRKNIMIIENEMAVECIMWEGRCKGINTIDNRDHYHSYYCDHLILATGGCGALFETTSNDRTVTGDGIAIAYKAGARIEDIEFIQFHPTMLKQNSKGHHFLISEAVRGEGAILVDQNDIPFMAKYHKDLDLAPRDVVTRAMVTEEGLGNQVYLKIDMIEHFSERFPQISSLCEEMNIDWKSGYIPVIPGAHFLMGGIQTNLKGETTVPGLYAVGETASTRVHGANRLASNSLLECIVFANRLADWLIKKEETTSIIQASRSYNPSTRECIDLPTIAEIQAKMMKYVGIEREEKGLKKILEWLRSYQVHHISSITDKFYSKKQIEQLHMTTVAWLIASSAIERKESRGAHYRSDYPSKNDGQWGNRRIIRTFQQKANINVSNQAIER